jgi:hypothetical protein
MMVVIYISWDVKKEPIPYMGTEKKSYPIIKLHFMTEGMVKWVSTQQNWGTSLVYRWVHNTRRY